MGTVGLLVWRVCMGNEDVLEVLDPKTSTFTRKATRGPEGRKPHMQRDLRPLNEQSGTLTFSTT